LRFTATEFAEAATGAALTNRYARSAGLRVRKRFRRRFSKWEHGGRTIDRNLLRRCASRSLALPAFAARGECDDGCSSESAAQRC
jgi:hypothetical protein